LGDQFDEISSSKVAQQIDAFFVPLLEVAHNLPSLPNRFRGPWMVMLTVISLALLVKAIITLII